MALVTLYLWTLNRYPLVFSIFSIRTHIMPSVRPICHLTSNIYDICEKVNTIHTHGNTFLRRKKKKQIWTSLCRKSTHTHTSKMAASSLNTLIKPCKRINLFDTKMVLRLQNYSCLEIKHKARLTIGKRQRQTFAHTNGNVIASIPQENDYYLVW